MSELFDHTLKDLERDQFPAQDAMGFSYVCCGLFRQQMLCLLDAIESKPNHVLLRLKIPIPFQQLALRDWFLAILMLCDCWRREDCLNAMDGCPSDDRDMRPILGLGGCIAKVVCVCLYPPVTAVVF